MLFNSFQFCFAFLPLCLVFIHLLSRMYGRVAAIYGLIFASFVFYGWWNWPYLALMAGSILFNYAIASWVSRYAGKPGTPGTLILALGIVCDLALLGYFKYANFFLEITNSVAGTSFEMARLALPLGISFYTFTQITFLFDVRTGHTKSFNLRQYGLFVVFFPHLIAGPILHHREMMPQFDAQDLSIKPENLAVGLALFSIGLFKKVIFADNIAPYASHVFARASGGETIDFFAAFVGGAAFMLQVYFDFSGYSDMALGLARIFGIRLPLNFNSPLKARSIIEFWSRWHVTLTRFLTAYVYNPLTLRITRKRMAAGKPVLRGSRTKPGAFFALLVFPTIMTMFASGLWHGAAFQFLFWGLLHGFYLTVNHGWRMVRPRFWPDDASYNRIMRAPFLVLTLACVLIGMIFFRAESMSNAWNIFAGLFGLHGMVWPEAIAGALPGLALLLAQFGVVLVPGGGSEFVEAYSWIVALLAVALLAPNSLEIMARFEPALYFTPPKESTAGTPLQRLGTAVRWRPVPGWALVTAGIAALGILGLSQPTEFLYWQF